MLGGKQFNRDRDSDEIEEVGDSLKLNVFDQAALSQVSKQDFINWLKASSTLAYK